METLSDILSKKAKELKASGVFDDPAFKKKYDAFKKEHEREKTSLEKFNDLYDPSDDDIDLDKEIEVGGVIDVP